MAVRGYYPQDIPVRMQFNVGDNGYSFQTNKDAEKSLMQRVVELIKKIGGFRGAQLFNKTEKLWSELALPLPEGVKAFCDTSGVCWKMSALVNAVPDTSKALEAWGDMPHFTKQEGIPGEHVYRMSKIWHKTMDAGAMDCYAVAAFTSFFSQCKTVTGLAVKTGDVLDLGSQILQLTINNDIRCKAQEAQTKAQSTPEVVRHFQQEERCAVLKMTKSGCTAAGFAATAFLTGWLVPIAAAILSLSSTILAIFVADYQLRMDHKNFDFYDAKCVGAKDFWDAKGLVIQSPTPPDDAV